MYKLEVSNQKYDEIWDSMIKVLPYKDLKHGLYTFFRSRDAHEDKVGGEELSAQILKDSKEFYEYVIKIPLDNEA
ncbi:MAG: hypothetical protein ACRCWG_10870 [Sarcina sp.]